MPRTSIRIAGEWRGKSTSGGGRACPWKRQSASEKRRVDPDLPGRVQPSASAIAALVARSPSPTRARAELCPRAVRDLTHFGRRPCRRAAEAKTYPKTDRTHG